MPQNDLTPAQYRAIYDEARRRTRTLRRLREEMLARGCTWSIGSWSRYEHGLVALRWDARNALRRYARDNLRQYADLSPDAPMTPREAAAAVERVLMFTQNPTDAVVVGAETGSITIRPNGEKQRDRGRPPEVRVLSRTAPGRARKRYVHIRVSEGLGARLKRLRRERGQTWEEFEAWLLEGRDGTPET